MTANFVLVIEDDPDSATFFSEVLKTAGFEVEIAGDGATAAQRLREIVPTVVVLDLHLPYVGGIRLLEQIRSDPRLAPTRVLVATANDSLIHTVESQADVVLLKPVGIVQLRQIVTQLARRAAGIAQDNAPLIGLDEI